MAEHSGEGACARSVQRLKRRSEFLEIAATGNKIVASTLVLQADFLSKNSKDLPVATRDLPMVTVGFTVTKKQGGAVVRNRIRRRLKAVAAEIFPRHGQDGWRYVVIGRHTAYDAPYEVLRRDMSYAIRKLTKQAVGDKGAVE